MNNKKKQKINDKIILRMCVYIRKDAAINSQPKKKYQHQQRPEIA